MTKTITNVLTDEQLEVLNSNFPKEEARSSFSFPRIAYVSQDKLEGVGKNKKVTVEAGTFFLENQIDELDSNGNKIWDKKELGKTMEGIIFFQRKQLKFYDENTEKYTSSPIYDTNDETIPLFCDGARIEAGTPAELKALYEYTAENGKKRSKLEETRILYVLVDETVYQLNLRGSSMYSFLTYARSTQVPTVMTEMSSEAMSKGSIEWNKMTFETIRKITPDEASLIIEKQQEFNNAIELQKEFYSKK